MARATNNFKGGWGRATASPQLDETGGSPEARPQPPTVQLAGDVDHPDFREATGLFRCESRLLTRADERPELIVIAQSRPDVFASDNLNRLQRAAPLAGIITLVGSWCEGETRTGQPCPGVRRLYWYEFPAWWRRQLQLRAANRCPDWARPATQSFRPSEPGRPRLQTGLIVLRTPERENAEALADTLNAVGHSAVWQRYHRARAQARGALAGIWDGGQLSDAESADLADFCTQMSRDGARVITLLDFPRRDRVERAHEVGAAAVLGKPYLNSDLIATLESVAAASKNARAA